MPGSGGSLVVVPPAPPPVRNRKPPAAGSRGLICATTQVSACPHLRRGTLKPMMRHAQDLPQRAIVWCRISDARDEDTTGVDDQEQHNRRLADRLAWGNGPAATNIIVETDTTAYKRKRIKLPDGHGEKNGRETD